MSKHGINHGLNVVEGNAVMQGARGIKRAGKHDRSMAIRAQCKLLPNKTVFMRLVMLLPY